MGRRRVGGNSRVLRKKKLKLSKRTSTVDDISAVVAAAAGVKKTTHLRLKRSGSRVSSGKQRAAALEALQKQRSQLLKQQAAERMVLKEHTRELEARRQRIRKGENAKMERRELGKYIRQLREEQKAKHHSELAAVEEAVKKHGGKKASDMKRDADEWEDVEDDSEEFDEDELQGMFAHLTT
ncbi:uncharacterized protein Tco025E_01802 [Trypanosoma conorhini]|uniref:Uncharacterized protein n=1 Tax=Trypanosoma conorhini TaxID=83891 RepID=A0A422Q7L3_9TRYP|nr:uncharacterized protein Tco025E_01802 [Trypanosoma conorhini]RNF25956.1 hypothetical protein Tco025E_01802 [Trypanosoma conorhini]